MGIAVTVCSLPHDSMKRVLLSSMAKFKITFHCNSSADLYSKLKFTGQTDVMKIPDARSSFPRSTLTQEM